jgi:peptide/nickel transport system permease protein
MMNAPTSARRGILRSLTSKPLTVSALAVIALVTIAVCLAQVIAPYAPDDQQLAHLLELPSSAHWLGTDALGRDVYSRLLFGGQPALLGVLIAVVAFMVTGIVLGVLAGYIGGWVDRVIGGIVDVVMALPGIVIVLVVLSIFTQSLLASMLTFGILGCGTMVRIIRSECLSLREELFVSAAVVSGLGHVRIMLRHVVPGLIGPAVVQMSIFAGISLAVQTGLGFLGLATKPPAPSWGGMVGEAASVMQQDGFLLAVTGGVITLMTLAFGLLGDGIRDLDAERKRGASAGPRRRRAERRHSMPVADTSEAVDMRGRGAGGQQPPGILAICDYSVGFESQQGTAPVVNNISFNLMEGEILGLVGESGSGKTVTALSLLGLLPPNGRVLGGEMLLAGKRVSEMTANERRGLRGRRIGLVSQEPMVALDPLFTIGSQLSEVLRYLGAGPRKKRHTKMLELLASVHLPDPAGIARKYPHELSGGMIQRVAIAIALAGDPDVLIADEPTTALDVTVQAGILDLLRDLRDSRGMSVIFVTHDLGVVADVCDRVVVMSRGQLVESASVDDLFVRPQHEYTQRLLAATPSLVEA